MMKRVNILFLAGITGCLVAGSCDNKKNPAILPAPVSRLEGSINNNVIDPDFLSTLSAAGIFEAASQIGLDAKSYLVPLAGLAGHSYRRYRWSVGYHENGGPMISALPPEEETGWTPWERWYKNEKGIVRKESWVLYPLRDPTSKGVARWYKLEESGLAPRYMEKPASLERQLQLARIDEAANTLGFDANEILIKPLSAAGKQYYRQCRWVVIPHILGGDGPVIYILPSMDHSGEWPWESWYSEGKTSLIHHVHYTKPRPDAVKSWKEYAGAPQRPPEIFGVTWYWYNDTALRPAMANPK